MCDVDISWGQQMGFSDLESRDFSNRLVEGLQPSYDVTCSYSFILLLHDIYHLYITYLIFSFSI